MKQLLQPLVFGVLCVATLVCTAQEHKADLVVFSYHRPLQLYAFLESVERSVTNGLGQTQVIYRADNDAYASAYERVHSDFPWATFIAQGAEPRKDFKSLTMSCVFDSPHEYILFAVDDIIIKDYLDLNDCIKALEEIGAYGFYTRLGLNLTHCYTMNCNQPLPPVQQVKNGIYRWRFADGQSDWRYPHTLDMTIYRKRDIADAFNRMHFFSPNNLEAIWAGCAPTNCFGLCYRTSKVVNIPLNRVQNEYNNRHMACQVQMLLELFNRGLRIAVEDLFHINNQSAHIEYQLRFVERTMAKEQLKTEVHA